MAILLVAVCLSFSLLSVLPAHKAYAGIQATYYASPTGSGSTCSFASPCSLTGVQTKVRSVNAAMTGDIVVNLRGGTYTLTSSFVLDESDSGTNGWRVIYQNYTGETPVLSGGTAITGWTLFDAGQNIYRAAVPGSLETRQVYVNGVRAERAKADYGTAEYTALGLSPQSDGSGKVPGWTTANNNLQNWGNKSDIEFVFRVSWSEHRVGVSAIGGSTITMKSGLGIIQNSGALPIKNTPDYANARNVPDTVENAYELLNAEGEWYLDRGADYLYYKPRAGESMGTASVIAAVLETLVHGNGTPSDPVSNITFQGLVFAHATWLGPNGNNGYPDMQANFTAYPGATKDYAWQMNDWVQAPANITFSAARGIRFERNKFVHLGAVGLGLGNGSQGNQIVGNEFADISGNGMQIGGGAEEDHHPDDPGRLVKNNEISNNYVHNVAMEYRGGVGIWVGYADSTLIAHNEVTDLPYTGISVGWGWGFTDWFDNPFYAEVTGDEALIGRNKPNSSRNNRIVSNHVHDVTQYMKDGAAIYTLGAQPGLLIAGNVLHDLNLAYAAIYLDNGTRYATIRNNITYANARHFLVNDYDYREWNHDFEFNYWDTDPGTFGQNNSVMKFNGAIANGVVPAEIVDNAGIQPAYLNLLPEPAVNLAIGKTASAYYNNGTTAAMHAGGEADRAVDGNPNTKAQATNQYAWTIEVDLGAVYTLDKVRIDFTTDPPFAENLFATEYEIQVSTTGGHGNFTTVEAVTGGTGGSVEHALTPVNARYVRVKAIKPDGASQTGGMMAIAEIGVYGEPTFTPAALPHAAPAVFPDHNVAQGKAAAAYYNDGSPATMGTSSEAYRAVDGDPATKAQASGQYAWTQEVDLGEVYNINRINIQFVTDPPFVQNLYATEYEIQVSQTGGNGNFTTVASVTGGTGGFVEHTFDPVGARFVRVKAINPDAPSETGGQMAIAELQVYEYKNLAFGKAAAAYYNNGTTAVMLPDSEASKGVDGTIATKAQATNQYAWTYEVDLGAVYPVNHVNVRFALTAWATDFEIQTSVTGGNGNFTTVHTAGGFLGDSLRKAYLIDFAQVNARYIRVKAIAPNGAGQTGGQMAVAELQVFGTRSSVKLSELTDASSGPDKSLYLNISDASFTFQSGDVIAYDVKLLTNSPAMGGIDIVNTDSTRFRAQTWTDQLGLSGNPTADLTSQAYDRWYHRELTVPAAMVGKTAAKWLLAAENDGVSAHLQAMYANIVVKRAGVTQLVVYGNGAPTVNAIDSYANYVYTPFYIYNVVGRY